MREFRCLLPLSMALLLRILGVTPLWCLRILGVVHKKLCFEKVQQCNSFSVSNRPRDDGGGSQALYAAIALATSRILGVRYIHRNFSEVEHAVSGMEDFSAAWNRTFRFELLDSGPDYRQTFSIDSALETAKALMRLRQGISITSSVFRYLVDIHPSSLELVRPELRSIYRGRQLPDNESKATVRITFHARRGDVNLIDHPGRWTSNDELVEDFHAVRGWLGASQAIPEVVTDDLTGDMSIFDSHLGRVYRDDNPFDAFERLVRARVLVTGRSSFSYLAALINANTVIYRDFWHPPMPGWHTLEDVRKHFQRGKVDT